MKNRILRSRVSNKINRDHSDDSILDLILGEISFEPQHQVIIDRFCKERSLPLVTATSDGRSFLSEAIADGGYGNEEEFDLLLELHEALEDKSLWLLTDKEHQRYLSIGDKRQSGRAVSEKEEEVFQSLHHRLRAAGVVELTWRTSDEDTGEILIQPANIENRSYGIEIGREVPADLKERIKAAVLAVVGTVAS